MLLNIRQSLDIFQMVPHVSIIYWKYFHVNTFKTFNISLMFDAKTWKAKHWFYLLWYMWLGVHSTIKCINYAHNYSSIGFQHCFQLCVNIILDRDTYKTWLGKANCTWIKSLTSTLKRSYKSFQDLWVQKFQDTKMSWAIWWTS